LVISWAFEMTPEGVIPESQVDRTVKISQESGRRLDFSILLILSIVIIFMGLERFVFSDRDTSKQAPEKSGSENHLLPEKGAEPFPPEVQISADDSLTKRGLTPKSVAVLPFSVMSTGPDDAYFADGLTEEIINALSQLPDLMVTARTSAFHFKGQNLPVGEIARQLGVNHIVEGSVRRAGEQLRITAQLIRAEDGFHLWSETYDRRTEDTFAVQDDISIKVAEALNIILDDEQRQRMQQVGVRNVDAYIAFQKGFDLKNQAHRENADQISLLRRANQHFEDAIEHFPTFGDAYIEHSDLYTHILITEASGRLDGNINPSDIEFAAGYLRGDLANATRYSRDDSQRVMAELDRALLLGEWRGLKGVNDRALQSSGCYLPQWVHLTSIAFGNASAAQQAFQRNVVCDPLQDRGYQHVVGAMLLQGEWAAAQNHAEQRLANHDHRGLVRWLAVALAMQGKFDEAETILQQRTKSEVDLLSSMAMLTAIQGAEGASLEYANQLINSSGPDDLTTQQLAAQRGDRNEANRLAGQIDRRPFGYLVLMQAIYNCACGAPFDLEATPVFASMLKESGLPWPPVSAVKFPLKDW
jgi:adenylate cyclase